MLGILTVYKVDRIVTLHKWLFDGPVLEVWIVCQSEIKTACHDES